MEHTRVLLRLPDSTVRKRLSAALPGAAEAVPDRLIRATVRAAAQVVRGESAPEPVMSAAARGMVDDALWAMAARRWNVSST